jgi:hypothetical protein
MLADDVFEVQDARQNPLFQQNILITNDPNICFYAGAAMSTPEGLPLGTKLSFPLQGASFIIANQKGRERELLLYG